MNNAQEMMKALIQGETLILDSTGLEIYMTNGAVFRENRKYVQGIDFNQAAGWSIKTFPKWYENIPEGGVLCFVNNGKVETICGYTNKGFLNNYSRYQEAAVPLTKDQIQVFIDNALEVQKNGTI